MFDYTPVTAPYPGLRPFEPHEGEIFFGREGHTDRLLEILQRERFLAVIGPSGGGKSSLVRAGLLPALAAGRLGTGSHWRLALLRPGGQPLLALAQALIAPHALGPELTATPRSEDAAAPGLLAATVEDATPDAALIAAELRRQGPAGLEHLLAQAQARRVAQARAAGKAAPPPLNLLILADQFEEVFTYREAALDPTEGAAFVDLLLAARDRGAPEHAAATEVAGIRVVVALTMRTDFLGHCVQFAELPEAINRAQYLTPRLKAEEMKAAIVGPARLFSGDVDDGFADEIIAKVGANSDQLPLLQHALARWWREAELLDAAAPLVTAALTNRVGNVEHALHRHAEQIYTAMSSAEKNATKALFIAITEGREGGADAVRRPQRLGDVISWTGVDRAVLCEVIDRLSQPDVSFLHHGRDLTDASVIDLTHEALMRQWVRLKSWVGNEFDSGQDYRRWQKRAAEHATDQAGLLVGADLARALEWWNPGDAEPAHGQPTTAWASRYSSAQNQDALVAEVDQLSMFIVASRGAADAERRKLAERAALDRRRAKVARNLALGAIFAAFVSIFASYFAVSSRNLAQAEAKHAAEQKALADEAKAKSDAALKLVDDARAQLEKNFGELEQNKSELEKSLSDVKRAEAAREASLKEAKAERQKRTVELFESQLTHASLLARSEDYAQARQVLIESAKLDTAIAPDRRHARNLLAGHVATLGGAADKVYLADGQPLPALSGGVAVSPDGRYLAAAGERATLVLYDAASGALLKRLEGHDPNVAAGTNSPGRVSSIAFAPSGASLYSSGFDGRVIRWSIPFGEKLREWEASNGSVRGLAIRPDGLQLATGDDQGVITLWSLPEGRELGKLEGHKNAIADSTRSLVYSPDGERLASTSHDRTARIWDMRDGHEVRGAAGAAPGAGPLHVLEGHNDSVLGVDFSPDGRLLATSSGDRRIVLWDAERGTPQRVFTGHQNRVYGLRFSADGATLYSASRDNTLRAWDVASGATLQVFQGHEAGLWSVDLSPPPPAGAAPAASAAASASASAPAVPRATGPQAWAYTAANDGTLRRWPLPAAWPGSATGAAARSVAAGDGGRSTWAWATEGDEAATSAAIAPHGHWVVVGMANGALRLHALPGGALLGEVEKAHGNQVLRIAFSTDGHTLATGSHDHKAKLWSVVVAADGQPSLKLLRTIEDHKDSVHAVAFSPDGRRLATASFDGRIGLFDIATGKGRTVKAHEAEALSVSFDAKGEWLLSSGSDYKLRLWRTDHLEDQAPRELARLQDDPMWASVAPDGRSAAVVGRAPAITLLDLTRPDAVAQRLVGHESTVWRAVHSQDGRQLATVSVDMTLRLWDLGSRSLLFTQRLPAEWKRPAQSSALWDFDFRCIPETGSCWAVVPLTMGRVVAYRWPYERFPQEWLAAPGQ